MITRCKIYFGFFIFVVYANHENIFTTKISRSTVVRNLSIVILERGKHAVVLYVPLQKSLAAIRKWDDATISAAYVQVVYMCTIRVNCTHPYCTHAAYILAAWV